LSAQEEEFQDIPISNVEITFEVLTREGRQSFGSGIQYSEPLPLAMYGIWALRQGGVPVGVINLAQEAGPPPLPGCFQVLLATDQRAMWGRKCPHCNGYWRTSSPGIVQYTICCYCGEPSEAWECLSDAQRIYVEACCHFFEHLLAQNKDGKFSIKARNLLEQIEFDSEDPVPEFFVEKAKQTNFACKACGNKNDILGRYGYCSSCGTRNDDSIFDQDVENIRAVLNAGGSPVTALKETVDCFDTVGRNIARELCRQVRMTSRRRAYWEKANFAQLGDVVDRVKTDFDIDLLRSIEAADVAQATLMFYRRHLHAHKGGVVDQKYIADSGDKTVEAGQLVRENNESVHRFISSAAKLIRNLLSGFHSIIPAQDAPIKYHQDKLARIEKHRRSQDRPSPH
jgi:hypothetical protein